MKKILPIALCTLVCAMIFTGCSSDKDDKNGNDNMSETVSASNSVGDDISDAVSDVGNGVSDAVSDVGDGVSDAGKEVSEDASEMVSDVKD